MHPESKDILRSMTVIPYVEDLHRGGTSDEDEDYEEDQIVQTADHPIDGNGTQNNLHSK